MKEIRTIVEAYKSIDFSRTQAALATVVRVEGSSYRRAGARMLVLDDGTYLGGISGGCLEGDALRRAQKGIALGRSSVITYDTTEDDDYQIGVGLGCQGIVDVLFTPLRPGSAGNPVEILSGLTDIRRPEVLLTVTGSPDQGGLGRTFVGDAGIGGVEAFAGGFPGLEEKMAADMRTCLEDRVSRTVEYGENRIFIEVILPAIHVVAYGGNYDIRTLLIQVKEIGWDSTVVLNASRADRSLSRAATRVMDNREPGLPAIDAYTAVLLMSHDYRTDMENLKKVLPSAASYIGMLGPRKRADKIFDAMAEDGYLLGEADRRRIYAPAGLDIGAATPEEIALSILAEIRSHFSARNGASLRLRKGSIYGHPL
ncbi:XdhC family protein [Puia sp. P3]|uniref:XdhC family protein n=1 Tax=Puia sp. P3 TaxID=3423952 RepID=UPI003D67FD3E